jgi:outer membrane murein-binding lipoprotein Lpp
MSWGLVALALLAAGCSSRSKAKRPMTEEDRRLDARAQEVEAKNRELAAQLQQREAQIELAFSETTRAENAAGMTDLGCSGLTPAQAPARGMPRPGVEHVRVQLRRKLIRMTPNFSTRSVGGWRQFQGGCQVVTQ